MDPLEHPLKAHQPQSSKRFTTPKLSPVASRDSISDILDLRSESIVARMSL